MQFLHFFVPLKSSSSLSQEGKKRCFPWETGSTCRQQIGLKASFCIQANPAKDRKILSQLSREILSPVTRQVTTKASLIREKELQRNCGKDFVECSGELSGAICLKTLVLLGNDLVTPPDWSENSLVLFVRFFGFLSPFWLLIQGRSSRCKSFRRLAGCLFLLEGSRHFLLFVFLSAESSLIS